MADETKLTLDVTDVLKKLEQYDAKLDQIQKSYVELAKSGKSASKSFAPEGDGAVGQLQDINKLKAEYIKLKTASDTLKTALKSAYDPRAIAIYTKELKNADVGLKKLEQTGTAVGVNLKKIGKEGSLAAQVVSEAFGAITKATLILGALKVVAELTKEAVSLSVQFDRAQRSFNAFTNDGQKAAKLVTDLQGLANRNILNPEEVFQAGKSLLAFGEAADKLPNVLERIALISKATGKNFSELSTIYGKARTSGVLYAEDINQLVDAGIPIIQEFAKQLGVSEGAIKKLASEGKISFEELQLAFFNLSKEGSQFSKLAAEQANTLPNLYQGAINRLKPLLKGIGDFISNIAKGALLQFNILFDSLTGVALERRAQKVANEITDIAFGTDLAKKGAKENILFLKQKSAEEIQLEKEAADKRRELANANAKKGKDLTKQIAQLRLDAMKDGEAKELAQEQARYSTLLKELKKYGIDSAQATEQYEQNISKIKVKYFLERADQEQQFFNLQKDNNRLLLKVGQDNADEQNQAAKQGLDELGGIINDTEGKRKAAIAGVLNQSRADQLAYSQEVFKEAELASRQLFFSKKRSDKEIADYEKDVAKARAVFQLSIQQEELQRSLDFDTTLTSAEKASLRLRIENIKTEIAQITSGVGEKGKGDKKPKSFLELLGIKPGSDEEKAIQLAAQQVKAFFDEITQARIEAAAEQRRIADDSVSKAQEALDVELELQKNGFANNVDLRKQDLEDAKKAQAEAIVQQKKAAKQKALIDSATQVNSLITAGAQLFSAFSSVPIVGIGLAIGAIALMLTSFARLKANAKGAATQFREGGGGWLSDDGFIHGKSHAEGGNLLEVERGELMQVGQDGNKKRVSVVRREKVAEYFDLLDAANRGDKKALAKHAFELSGGEVDRGAISKRVFSVSSSESVRANETLKPILEKMLHVMTTEKPKDDFDRVNGIKRKGNTITYYK